MDSMKYCECLHENNVSSGGKFRSDQAKMKIDRIVLRLLFVSSRSTNVIKTSEEQAKPFINGKVRCSLLGAQCLRQMPNRNKPMWANEIS